MSSDPRIKQTAEDVEIGERAARSIAAEAKIIRALKPLTQRARLRILNYVRDYFEEIAEARADGRVEE